MIDESGIIHPPLFAEAKGGQEKEEDGDGEEVNDIGEVDDTARHGVVVGGNAKPRDGGLDRATRKERGDEVETGIEREAEEDSEEERRNLVVRKRRGKEREGDINHRQEKQANHRTPIGTRIDIADGFGKIPNRKEIDNCGQQREDDEGKSSKVLAQRDTEGGDRLGEQEFDGAKATLLGNHAHANGRYKEEIEPRSKGEKSVNLSIARVEHVPFAREDPKEQARKDKEKTNDKIAGGGSEELRHFFPEDREHDS